VKIDPVHQEVLRKVIRIHVT